MIGKVEKGRSALKSLKRQNEKISKSKIAKLCGFSRSLLSPDKNGKYKNKDWKDLANDIVNAKKLSSSLPKRDKLIEIRKTRDDFANQLKSQVQQNVELASISVEAKNEISYYKNRYDEIANENNELNIKLNRYRNNLSHYSDTQSIANNVKTLKRIVISPDNELLTLTGGEYRYDDSLILKKAHKTAQYKLQTELTKTLPKRLYITIGLPASGKSTWIETHEPPHDRLPIYYDATNSTAGERFDITEIARASVDCKICFVFFDISIEICLSQNAKRPYKNISDGTISNFIIEPPDFYEYFDEILVIRV